MKKNIFLGIVIWVGITILYLYSCNQNAEKQRKHAKNLVKNKNTNLKEIVINPISHNHKKVIYLTFDDGPNKGTENVMKVVNHKKIPVSVFIIGKHVLGTQKQMDNYTKLQKNKWILVANHSYSHADNQYEKYYNNYKLVLEDFHKNKEIIKLKNNFARTPGRNIWRLANVESTDIRESKTAADSLGKKYQLYGWDLEWKYTKNNTLKNTPKQMIHKVDSVFSNNLTKVENHLVILTHDQLFESDENKEFLNEFITLLQKKDEYDFRFISEYPTVRN